VPIARNSSEWMSSSSDDSRSTPDVDAKLQLVKKFEMLLDFATVISNFGQSMLVICWVALIC